jgi:hypothetical protein
MNYKLIHNFLNKHFQEIESVVLFGSYIDNPSKANDIDLLLLSKKFFYSSKESFLFEGMKINVIKFNISEVFSILAKHYQQGDFYKLVFTKGVVIKDKFNDVLFVKKHINSSYPKNDKDIIAFGLNEILFKLNEHIDTLNKPISSIEFYLISAKIISHLMDWVLFTNHTHNLKSEKFKSRFFDKNFPAENSKLLKLIFVAQKNNQKKFLQELEILVSEFNIPLKEKYSNDLIFDDYSQSSLILYLESLFNFNEIKQIIDTIKSENKELQFYIYQVDEDNQEKKGCYIVFDNNDLEFENNKQKWIKFFQKLFSNQQYTFPYNNIFCYPEIKFIGKHNLKLVIQLLTNCTDTINRNQLSKESFLLDYINEYISKYTIKIEDVYHYYLAKLNSKTHSSNYLTQNQKTTELKFMSANARNEKIVIQHLREVNKNNFNVNFPIFENVPIWFHIQVIDMLISIINKTDFEKLFYINCLKKTNVQISKL